MKPVFLLVGVLAPIALAAPFHARIDSPIETQSPGDNESDCVIQCDARFESLIAPTNYCCFRLVVVSEQTGPGDARDPCGAANTCHPCTGVLSVEVQTTGCGSDAVSWYSYYNGTTGHGSGAASFSYAFETRCKEPSRLASVSASAGGCSDALIKRMKCSCDS